MIAPIAIFTQNFVLESNPLIGFQHSVLLFSAIFASFNAFWPGQTVHSLFVAPPLDFFCARARALPPKPPLVLDLVLVAVVVSHSPASRSDS
ncbi:hypothetical protein VE04_08004 [Pseudogymnoascus sp. 24MN13]|nr:hypothetical protein VE04_08004 [Pseudogymnoascus sp. 24MN13]